MREGVSGRLTIGDLMERARARIARFEPASALAAQRSGALLVDTRCAELRRAAGTIPGAAHVPLSVLFWRLDPSSGHSDPRFADFDREIVLVCSDGYSSSIAAATLCDLGFSRVGDLAGGFSAWAAAGLPVEHATD